MFDLIAFFFVAFPRDIHDEEVANEEAGNGVELS